MNRDILLPMCAMVGVTFLVWLRLFYQRVTLMISSGKRLQATAHDPVFDEVFAKALNVSECFINLFEVPVLFYAAVLAIFASGTADRAYVTMAWMFVGFRAFQALVHCTYNRILHRLTGFLLGALTVWAMWGRFACHLLCPSQ
jgi:hypothetical protein